MKQSSRIQMKLIVALILCGLALSGCRSTQKSEFSGTLTISGAWALYPMVVKWSEEFHAQYPDVQFDVSAGGAGKGMADTLAGAVDMGMVSRSIFPEEVSQGAVGIAVTIDAVVPTLNAGNPHLALLQKQGLTRAALESIWLGKATTWGQVLNDPQITDEIHVYTRSDACGAAETWAAYLGKYKQEDLQGVAVYGDPGLATAVSEDPLGIGFNNLNFAYDADSGKPLAGLQVQPLDINEDGQVGADENWYAAKADLMAAIANNKYPSPPARALYVVTKGAPEGLEESFIRWVLTDGQAFVEPTGYIPLTAEQLKAELEKLEAGAH